MSKMKRATCNKIDRIVKLAVVRLPLPLILVGLYFIRSFWAEMLVILISFMPYLVYNKIGQPWLFRQIED